ncbi:hypothetical protein SCHPADRAFT_828488 [Schizopora paradoxa]|uniref:Ferritin-like domain-containing protein n=1 Tax=Schizopora paradoxa TaxID=27342 RepID=A0A0H2RME6_9AGAM|nr:hypothetical protein SCHPADRAFT_828488 [Schizopora paradoxa]
MKSTIFSATAASVLAAVASGALAVPVEKRAVNATPPTVTQVLQFALTLEHLESTFYNQGLEQFDADAFEQAGFPDWVRGRFVQIAQHEATHVTTLENALGNNSFPACNYSFPVTDPVSFATLGMTLEGVGASAYLGSAGNLVSEPAVLQVAGSILPMEARHNGWISASVMKQAPWSSSFETALDPNQVFTLASTFITSCPSTTPQLPFTTFPSLTFEGTPTPGQVSTLDFNVTSSSNSSTNGTLSVAFLVGRNQTFVPLSANNSVTIPAELQGMVYAVVTNSDTNATDATTVAGPAILQFPFNSNASNF